MFLELRPKQILTQKQVMTPQLQQATEIKCSECLGKARLMIPYCYRLPGKPGLG